ncbi:MAG: LysM peptidoglycan-binding domain-containing protein [Caldilineaceae bacterium]|nr:LysM peptidoglycan-binding domain-containing protein [Caldilineaceae bacterium]
MHLNLPPYLALFKSRASSPLHWTTRVFLLIAVAGIFGTILPTSTLYAQTGIHTVARGESLGLIARRYNVNTNELMAENGISNPDFIYVGQRLFIPGLATDSNTPLTAANSPLPNGDGYHVVRPGDTLSQIAKLNGLTLSELLRLNGLTNPNVAWAGQKLRVTARVAPVQSSNEVEPQLAVIYIVKAGDTLEALAAEYHTTVEALLRANGLPHEKFMWVGQRLRILSGVEAAGAITALADGPVGGRRWIEVNLSSQTLIAWQGDVAVMKTLISSGRAATPTVTGRFKVGTKYSSQRMVGPGYDLPGVPWVMYFYGGYAIHGAYWHNNFGQPMSHGCVNMTPGEAQLLYDWAAPGTEVYVHY